MSERVAVQLLKDGAVVYALIDEFAEGCRRDRLLAEVVAPTQTPLQVSRPFRQPVKVRDRGGQARSVTVTLDETFDTLREAQRDPAVTLPEWDALRIRTGDPAVGGVLERTYAGAGLQAVTPRSRGRSRLTTFQFAAGQLTQSNDWAHVLDPAIGAAAAWYDQASMVTAGGALTGWTNRGGAAVFGNLAPLGAAPTLVNGVPTWTAGTPRMYTSSGMLAKPMTLVSVSTLSVASGYDTIYDGHLSSGRRHIYQNPSGGGWSVGPGGFSVAYDLGLTRRVIVWVDDAPSELHITGFDTLNGTGAGSFSLHGISLGNNYVNTAAWEGSIELFGVLPRRATALEVAAFLDL